MADIIGGIIEFVKSLFITPFVNIYNDISEQITNLSASISPNIKSFLGASINTFIPVQSIGICLSIIVPVLTANLVIAVILRIKSFVPTMGGK